MPSSVFCSLHALCMTERSNGKLSGLCTCTMHSSSSDTVVCEVRTEKIPCHLSQFNMGCQAPPPMPCMHAMWPCDLAQHPIAIGVSSPFKT